MISSVGNSVGTSSYKMLMPPSGVYAVSLHVNGQDATHCYGLSGAVGKGLHGEGSPSGSWVLFTSENDADSTDDLLPPSRGWSILSTV